MEFIARRRAAQCRNPNTGAVRTAAAQQHDRQAMQQRDQ